jgi:DNA-binding NtrC family response regulator
VTLARLNVGPGRDTTMPSTPIARPAAGLVPVPMRILVVDDEPLIRWSICAALAAEGFDAVSAADTLAAAGLAGEWPPPRVVLFDLRAPDRDALEVLSAMRAVHPHCRFIIMTTARDCVHQYAFVEGVELIEKPFVLAHVVRLVKELADRRTTGEARA